jgi:hypothetical protein
VSVVSTKLGPDGYKVAREGYEDKAVRKLASIEYKMYKSHVPPQLIRISTGSAPGSGAFVGGAPMGEGTVIGKGSGAAALGNTIGTGNAIGTGSGAIGTGNGIGTTKGAAVRGDGNLEAAVAIGEGGVPGMGEREGAITGAGVGPLNSPLHHDKRRWKKFEKNLISIATCAKSQKMQ